MENKYICWILTKDMALGFAKTYTSAFLRVANIVLEVRGGMVCRNQWMKTGISVSEHSAIRAEHASISACM